MNPHSSSLFHFTKRKTVFKQIIENGLRYSFSFEPFPDEVVNNMLFHGFVPPLKRNTNLSFSPQGIAIPMICFCDIPLTRVNCHTKVFGKYSIGISKDYLCHFYSDFLNPVFYADSNKIFESLYNFSKAEALLLKYISTLALNNDEYSTIINSYDRFKHIEFINKLPNEIREIFEYIIDYKQSINNFISLVKPTYENKGDTIECHYDEHEWRAIYPNIRDSAFEWFIGGTEEETKKIIKKLNKSLNKEESAFISMPGDWFNMISHIIVPKENDIPSISDFILTAKKLFGNTEIEDYQRFHLISKITSFERIENDY